MKPSPSLFLLFGVCLLMPSPSHGESPVWFADPDLKEAVERELFTSDPTPEDMLGMASLGAAEEGISDLAGLEYALNLRDLNVSSNSISDLSPLSDLTHLVRLDLHGNQISDISALRGLTRLRWLDLQGNPLSQQAYFTDLAQIKDNNPGISLYFDQHAKPEGVSASDDTLDDRVYVAWDALYPGPDNPEIQYMVCRATSPSGLKEAVSGWLDGTSFEDTTAALDVHYWYWVESSLSGDNLSDPDEGWRTLRTRTLTISSGTNGSVSTPGEGVFPYDYRTVVTIIATPATNYHFVEWTGSAVTAGKVANRWASSTTVTMDADYTLQASFAIDRHTLGISATWGGSVSSPGMGSFEYDHGTNVPLIATPITGCDFLEWTGSAVTAGKVADPWSASTIVTMDADYSLEATFDFTVYYLTVSTTPGGSVLVESSRFWPPGPYRVSVSAGEYYKEYVGVRGVPDAHYHFNGWTGTAVDAGVVRNWDYYADYAVLVKMLDNYTIQANFSLDTHTLTLNATDGSIIASPSKPAYDYGETVTLQATANTGYRFANWSGALTGDSNSITLTMDGDKTVTAQFVLDQYVLAVSSSEGGAVVNPGEGSFPYDHGTSVPITATADPNYRFVNWSGTAADANKVADTNAPETTVLMNGDYTLVANFESELDTLFVGPSGSADPNADGTQDHPLGQVQDAIEVAAEGGRVVIAAGTYTGPLDLLGKAIELTGAADPNDPNEFSWVVIDAQGAGSVLSFTHAEGADTVVRGLVLTGGKGDKAGAIYCAGSSPTVLNCLIVGNCATDPNGGTVYCQDSNAVLVNCTIADNLAGEDGAGVYLVNSNVLLWNSILWGNSPTQIMVAQGPEPTVLYCDVAGGWAGITNLTLDPLFAQPGHWENAPGSDTQWIPGDYHLMSAAGRLDPVTLTWVEDTATSPCIDAGDPVTDWTAESSPNGGRVNIGAYGGTSQASRSPE